MTADSSKPPRPEKPNLSALPQAPAKLPYARPTLREFGSVSNLTMNGNGTQPTDGGSGIMNMTSDRRTKENIVRVGEHPLGIGLYLFSYKADFQQRCGAGRYLGVMADEVEPLVPQAVSVDASGYKMVDYSLLAASAAASH